MLLKTRRRHCGFQTLQLLLLLLLLRHLSWNQKVIPDIENEITTYMWTSATITKKAKPDGNCPWYDTKNELWCPRIKAVLRAKLNSCVAQRDFLFSKNTLPPKTAPLPTQEAKLYKAVFEEDSCQSCFFIIPTMSFDEPTINELFF